MGLGVPTILGSGNTGGNTSWSGPQMSRSGLGVDPGGDAVDAPLPPVVSKFPEDVSHGHLIRALLPFDWLLNGFREDSLCCDVVGLWSAEPVQDCGLPGVGDEIGLIFSGHLP